MVDQALFSSLRGDWETPGDLLEELQREFAFDLDAAASGWNAVTPSYLGFGGAWPDALDSSRSWAEFGTRIFCNPPYGRGVGAWIDRALEAQARGALVVLLLPARTDTQWFHALLAAGAEVRFLRGRLKFTLLGEPLHPAPFPSVVIVLRPASTRWTLAPPLPIKDARGEKSHDSTRVDPVFPVEVAPEGGALATGDGAPEPAL